MPRWTILSCGQAGWAADLSRKTSPGLCLADQFCPLMSSGHDGDDQKPRALDQFPQPSVAAAPNSHL
jgi:hypothetical protein